VIVIVGAARDLLVDRYGADPGKIVVIPHGVPDIPFGGNVHFKKMLGYEGFDIISSFGLLGRSKGYEFAIKAMPKIVKQHPNTKLLLLGETHPVVLRNSGEEYRESLLELVKKLKLENNVVFVNHYLTVDEIVQYLRASDVYVTPYPNLEQVSSGTLSYAISAGLACVSTPYVYASEMLDKGRGLLFKRGSHNDLAEKINFLLDEPRKRHEIAKKAYALGRNMIWPRVAYRHLDLFEIVAKNSSTNDDI
jgi:glycosyltransferase involved in cell wall biosynthesis